MVRATGDHHFSADENEYEYEYEIFVIRICSRIHLNPSFFWVLTVLPLSRTLTVPLGPRIGAYTGIKIESTCRLIRRPFYALRWFPAE